MTRRTHPSAVTESQKAAVVTATLALGRTRLIQGNLKPAEECFRQVLAVDGNNADALHLLGVTLLQAGSPDEAIRLIKRAVRRNPRDPAMLVNLGAAYGVTRRLQDARKAYEDALKLSPDLSEAHFNLGKVLFDLEDLDASIAASKKSIALNPMQAGAYVTLGNAYKYKRDTESALAAYYEATRLVPRMAQAWGNIAAIHVDQCNFTEALALLNNAVALAPGPGELPFKRSLVGLRLGYLAAGWDDYESRFFAETEPIPRFDAPPPFWTGEDLSDKTILLRTEQGLGDEILYASMIEETIARAKSCVLECTPRMVPVFARSFPTAKVLRFRSPGERTTPASEFDTQISVASLGQFLRRDFAHFPRHEGYLKADPLRTAALRARYAAISPGNPIVGVSWRSKNTSIGETKSAGLANWGPVLRVPGVTFVNLQYGSCEDELREVKEKLGVDIFQDADIDSMKSMDDFFAQVAAMDLVITTSNTTVHVAGSLNVPTWLMLNSGSAALWYWFIDRNDSPWYPSVRIFRRPSGDLNDKAWWQNLIVEMGDALAARLRNAVIGAKTSPVA